MKVNSAAAALDAFADEGVPAHNAASATRAANKACKRKVKTCSWKSILPPMRLGFQPLLCSDLHDTVSLSCVLSSLACEHGIKTSV